MTEVDYLAVFISGVAAFAVGALWYGPFFGKRWKDLMGVSTEAPGSAKMSLAKAMAGGFITTLVITFVLANVFVMVSVASVTAALTLTFWIWLGFIATTMLNSVWYENRTLELYLINASHYLVALLLAALVLAWWPW